jgi:hypothetical protein
MQILLYSFFISIPVCLVIRAYEGLPTIVSLNPAWAARPLPLPNYKQTSVTDVRPKALDDDIFLSTGGQNGDTVTTLS